MEEIVAVIEAACVLCSPQVEVRHLEHNSVLKALCMMWVHSNS